MKLERKKNRKNRQGFSFVEVLVSFLLISVGLIAAISLVSANLAAAINNRNQSIAGLLAQEGIELVINIRDNNVERGENPFDSGFPASDANDCIIDTESALDCTNPENILLYSAEEKGYYHSTTDPFKKETKFKRKISIDRVDGDHVAVVSMVTWEMEGEAFPPATPTGCNSSSKCAYTQTTLTSWK